jgi:hypothetical protein
MIRRYTERKSTKILIVWTALLFLFSTYDAIVYALVVPARSLLMLFVTVFSWSATLCYATLLVIKLRARRSGQR